MNCCARFPLRARGSRGRRPGVEQSALAERHTQRRRTAVRGCDRPHKGQDVLLAALAELDDHEIGVAAVSAASTTTRRSSTSSCVQTQRAGLADRVTFTGPLDGSRPRRGASRPRTCSCTLRAMRATAWSSPRHSPAACPSSRPRAGGLVEALGTTPDGERRRCSSRPAMQMRSPGDLRVARPTTELRRRLRRCGPHPAPCAHELVDDHATGRHRAGRAAMTHVRVAPSWLAVREPADAAARATDLVEEVRPYLPVGRPLVDPRSRLRYRRDDAMARAATAGSAALGQPRSRPRPARADRTTGLARQPADGSPVTVETRHSDVTRLTPTRSPTPS